MKLEFKQKETPVNINNDSLSLAKIQDDIKIIKSYVAGIKKQTSSKR